MSLPVLAALLAGVWRISGGPRQYPIGRSIERSLLLTVATTTVSAAAGMKSLAYLIRRCLDRDLISQKGQLVPRPGL